MDNEKYQHLCMSCMNEKGDTSVCPICGFKGGTQPDSPLYLQPGTILNGQYILGRVLGHGGFGITYLAMDLNLDIKAAIKEYLPEGLAARTVGSKTVSVYIGEKAEQFNYGVERFLEEARILAKFYGESGIVAIKNFFMENGTAYYVMDYLDGMNLKQYIQG
jgi:serine/threonine protein kinase